MTPADLKKFEELSEMLLFIFKNAKLVLEKPVVLKSGFKRTYDKINKTFCYYPPEYKKFFVHPKSAFVWENKRFSISTENFNGKYPSGRMLSKLAIQNKEAHFYYHGINDIDTRLTTIFQGVSEDIFDKIHEYENTVDYKKITEEYLTGSGGKKEQKNLMKKFENLFNKKDTNYNALSSYSTDDILVFLQIVNSLSDTDCKNFVRFIKRNASQLENSSPTDIDMIFNLLRVRAVLDS